MSEEEIRRTFAKNLNTFLELNGYNQADLARQLHVSKTTASKWCKGKAAPRMDKIQAITKWLGLENGDLVIEHVTTPDETYYIDKEAREMADFLHKNPEYRVLFDASRKVKREDINFVKTFMDRVTDNE